MRDFSTDEIHIRIEGVAGRITLTRSKALNALSVSMCEAISFTLHDWEKDDSVEIVLIDAEGEKAFCAGGDLIGLYNSGLAGDFAYGRNFWRTEYALNLQLSRYAKPIVGFMQGFVMGGGVGLGCHLSHRIVNETSRIALPECGIGLVPDVGSSALLAMAPGHIGEYLATTGHRFKADDAVYAGFADMLVRDEDWRDLKQALVKGEGTDAIFALAQAPACSELEGLNDDIDRHFSKQGFSEIVASLSEDSSAFAGATLAKLEKVSPFSADCTQAIIQALRPDASLKTALMFEYRFTHRSMEHSDFLEGIRAAVIDKDRSPVWKPREAKQVAEILSPLVELEWDLKG